LGGLEKRENQRANQAERKISLIMIIRQFYPLIGGTEKQADLLARMLQRSGLTVKLVTAKLGKEWKRNESIGGLEVTRLLSPQIKVIGTLIYALSLIYYLIKHRKHYDIIHVHRADYDAVIATPLGKLMGKKVLVKLACSGPFGDVECLKRSPISSFALWIIAKADRIVVVNEDIKEELLGVGFKKGKIVKIPNGVDITVFKPMAVSSSSTKKVVTFVGRLHEQKGLEYLLRGWKGLIERFRISASSFELHLDLIGEGPLKEKLIAITEELGISKSIHFLGSVNNVVDYFQYTDIFVNSSLSEGISNSLLEAMACGLPIVATNISGNTELIQNEYTGLLVPPRDLDALCIAMECLLTDVKKAKNLGMEARMIAETRYSCQIVAKEYMRIYHSLLD
jgi:glycosyltransferase involved in cell wall biosynthesis